MSALDARLDADNDGTLDLDEAKKAASVLFDKLDADKDGTLDLKELKRRVTDKEFKAPIRTTTARRKAPRRVRAAVDPTDASEGREASADAFTRPAA